MARERLTLNRIAKLSCPENKSQAFLFDTESPSLAVRVTRSGQKSYVFEGKLDRCTIRKTIGDVQDWSLEKAQAEARRLATLIDKGIDPREEERKKQEAKEAAAHALEAAKKYTLKNLYEAYCTTLDKAGKKDSARIARSLFKNHVPENLAGRTAADVKDEEFADVLRAVTEKGKTRTAGALRTYLQAAYKKAIAARLSPKVPLEFKAYRVMHNPIAQIDAVETHADTRTLTNTELTVYFKELGDRKPDKALALALLAGGQRIKQLLRATAKDWTPDTSTLRLFDPKGRRKQPRIHLLPLGPKAAAIVKALVADVPDNNDLLLKLDPLTPGKRIKEICEAKKLTPFNVRDVRRTVETRMASLGISKDTRSQVQSHGIGGVQDKHYDMHDYAAEKRAALVAWERFIDGLITGKKADNVVRLGGRKRKA